MVVVKFLVFVSEVVSIFSKIITWIIGGAKGYLCQRCKSLFEVGEAILREGPYFIIFWGAYATFSPSWKILGGAIAPVAPPGFAPMTFAPPTQLWGGACPGCPPKSTPMLANPSIFQVVDM